MINYQIGNVVGVSGDSVSVALLDYAKDPHGDYGVRETMTVNLPGDAGTEVIIGQPGSFVGVALPKRWLLCLVVEAGIRSDAAAPSGPPSGEASALRSGAAGVRYLGTVPIGTFSDEARIETGSDLLPALNAPVFAVGLNLIEMLYTSHAEGDFALGRLSLIPGQVAKANLDAFLTRHAAILGKSGAGKSWAVASIVQKLCNYQQATIVLFDLHGEYTGTFGESADVISGQDLELPYWLMRTDELIDLLFDKRDPSSPGQILHFKELMQQAKRISAQNQALGIDKVTVDTPVYFDMQFILKEIRRLNREVLLTDKGPQPGAFLGMFTHFLLRIDSLMNDRRYDFIFSPRTYTTSASMEDLLGRLLGRNPAGPKKVVVIDLSPVPFEVRSPVISIILRCLFDFAYWYRRIYTARFPIAIFADEAHLYLHADQVETAPARRAAERIVKEGRKYGMSLTVISQRPREVSATILSQCNTFLCLRLSHPDDQEFVRNLLPDYVRGVVQLLATLRRGEAILLGDSVAMPTRLRIDPPDPAPQSSDASFREDWSHPPADLDVTRVLAAWRNQRI